MEEDLSFRKELFSAFWNPLFTLLSLLPSLEQAGSFGSMPLRCSARQILASRIYAVALLSTSLVRSSMPLHCVARHFADSLIHSVASHGILRRPSLLQQSFCLLRQCIERRCDAFATHSCFTLCLCRSELRKSFALYRWAQLMRIIVLPTCALLRSAQYCIALAQPNYSKPRISFAVATQRHTIPFYAVAWYGHASQRLCRTDRYSSQLCHCISVLRESTLFSAMPSLSCTPLFLCLAVKSSLTFVFLRYCKAFHCYAFTVLILAMPLLCSTRLFSAMPLPYFANLCRSHTEHCNFAAVKRLSLAHLYHSKPRISFALLSIVAPFYAFALHYNAAQSQANATLSH